MKKLAIAVSAGLDSFTMVHLAKEFYKDSFEKDVQLVSIVDDDCPYADKELNTIVNLYDVGNVHLIRLVGYGQLVNQENSHVVLGRNAVIASILAGVAPQVWIGATVFEDNTEMYDKNGRFFAGMTRAMTQACGYTRKSKTLVMSPFQDLVGNIHDKHEMIKWLEDKGCIDWRKTISCFHPTHKRCGECAVCGKRFVYEKYAELCWGIRFATVLELEETYITNPWQNKHLWTTWEKMQVADNNNEYKRYHKERIRVYKTVLYEKSREDKSKINRGS